MAVNRVHFQPGLSIHKFIELSSHQRHMSET